MEYSVISGTFELDVLEAAMEKKDNHALINHVQHNDVLQHEEITERSGVDPYLHITQDAPWSTTSNMDMKLPVLTSTINKTSLYDKADIYHNTEPSTELNA